MRQFVTVPFKFYPSQPGSGVQTTGTGNSLACCGKHIVTDLKFNVCWRKIPGPGIPGPTTRTVTQAASESQVAGNASFRLGAPLPEFGPWPGARNLGHGREVSQSKSESLARYGGRYAGATRAPGAATAAAGPRAGAWAGAAAAAMPGRL